MNRRFYKTIPLIGFVSTTLVVSTLFAQPPKNSGSLPQEGVVSPSNVSPQRGGANPFSGADRHDNRRRGGMGGMEGGRPAATSAAQIVKKRESLSDEERADLEKLRNTMRADGVEYLRKVQLPNGKYRYFYTRKAYEAWLKNQKPSTKEKKEMDDKKKRMQIQNLRKSYGTIAKKLGYKSEEAQDLLKEIRMLEKEYNS